MDNAVEREDVYLVDLLLGTLKSWWKIALVGIIGALVGVGLAFLMPKEYEAVGTAVIAPPKFRSPLRPSILPVAAYKQMLMTEGTLAQVLANLPEASGLALRDLVEGATVETVEMGKEHAPALILKMRLGDPQLAAQAVDAWLKVFREMAVRLTTTQAKHTERFVREQFESARKRLLAAEKQLHQFDAKNNLALLQRLQEEMLQRLAAKKAALKDAQSTLIRLKKEKELVEEQLRAHLLNGRWVGMVEGDVPKEEGMAGLLRKQILATKNRYKEAENAYSAFLRENDIEGLSNEVNTLANTLSSLQAERDTLSANLAEKEAYLEALQAALKETPQTEKVVLTPESSALWQAVLGGRMETLSKLRLVSESPSEVYKKILLSLRFTAAEVARLKERLSTLAERTKQLAKEHARKQALLGDLRRRKEEIQEHFTTAKKEFSALWQEFLQLQSRKRTLTVQIRKKQDEIATLKEEIKSLTGDFDDLNARIEALKEQRSTLQREVEVLQKPYDMLKGRVEEARLALAEPPEDVRVAVKPVPPDKPVFPKKWLFALVGGVLGIFGAGFVVVLLVAKRLISQGGSPAGAPSPSAPETPPSQGQPASQHTAAPDSKDDTAP